MLAGGVRCSGDVDGASGGVWCGDGGGVPGGDDGGGAPNK